MNVRVYISVWTFILFLFLRLLFAGSVPATGDNNKATGNTGSAAHGDT